MSLVAKLRIVLLFPGSRVPRLGSIGAEGVQFSVVVPFRNARNSIADCVESLLTQSYPADDFEIIVVDNDSTDGSAELVSHHPRLNLTREAKRGAYAARNRGASEASGTIIAFTDADCVPDADWLSRIDAEMRSPRVGIVIGSLAPAGSSFALSALTAYEDTKDEYVLTGRSAELYYGHAGNMAVRRGLFEELGGFVERDRGSDTEFVRRAVDRQSCDVVRYCREAAVKHTELTGPWAYYRKMFVYARHRRSESGSTYARPLQNRERMHVFRAAAREHGYSTLRSARAGVLLSLAAVSWTLGRWSASLIRVD